MAFSKKLLITGSGLLFSIWICFFDHYNFIFHAELIQQKKELKNDLKRLKIASVYDKTITSKHVIIPKKRKNSSHVYHLYVIQCKNRDKLLAFLKKNKIFAGIHYPIPIHKQKIYKNKKLTHLKNTEIVAKNILSLPIYPELAISDVIKISKLINKFYEI